MNLESRVAGIKKRGLTEIFENNQKLTHDFIEEEHLFAIIYPLTKSDDEM